MTHAKCARSAVLGLLAGLLSVMRLVASPETSAGSSSSVRPLPPDLCVAQDDGYRGCDGWWESSPRPTNSAELPPAVAPPVEPAIADGAPRAAHGKHRPTGLLLAAPGTTTRPTGGVRRQWMLSTTCGTPAPAIAPRTVSADRSTRALWGRDPGRLPNDFAAGQRGAAPPLSLLVCIGSYAELAERARASANQDAVLAWNAANDGLGPENGAAAEQFVSARPQSEEFESLIAAITRQSLLPRGFAGGQLVEGLPAPWVAGLAPAPPAVAPSVDLTPLLPGLEERLFGQLLTPAIQQGGRLLSQWWSAEAIARTWLLEKGLQAVQVWGEPARNDADSAANSTQLWPHEAEFFGL